MAFFIRCGAVDEADACYRIAIAQPRGTLPKLYRVHFAYSACKGELHVADTDGAVVGFARFHTRRDGWTTLYDLAVAPDAQGQGIGRNLLYSVPTPFRLKCPQASAANAFYRNAGLKCVGRDGALNVYELRLLTIFCQGKNQDIPTVARQGGMAYGACSKDKAYAYPFMLDAPFKPKHWNWEKHLQAVTAHRPVMAWARDYMRPEQREDVLMQLECFRALGVLRPAVCCKFEGAVNDIPSDVVIGISLYSDFAGWLPSDLRQYAGRKVHFLGGTPGDWQDKLPKLHGAGAHVLSADGNSQQRGSKTSSHWENTWKRRNGEKADPFWTMVYGTRQVVRILNGGEAFQRQESLW